MTTPVVPLGRVRELLGAWDTQRPLHRALTEALRLVIADGRVAVGHRLPSERDLAAGLAVSRTTVTAAYAALREAGYLTARRGSGNVVTVPAVGSGRRAGRSLFPAGDREDVIDLTCAATRAPAGTAQAYEAAVRELPAHLAGPGYVPLGLPELRQVVAERYAVRGLPTSPDQVLITSGAVAGLAIVGRALLRPGGRVVVESPGYPNSIEELRRTGARLTPLPVDPLGWDVAAAERVVRAAAADLALLVPDYQNPTGALMPDETRERLAAALSRAGTRPVIDETIVEIALDDPHGDPPGPLPFAAFHEHAILLGSASKSHWGGLRIGWIRAETAMVGRLLEARATVDLGAPILEQLVLLHLLRHEPGLDDERRADLRAGRDHVADLLRSQLPDARFVVPRGGLSLWVELSSPIASRVVDRCEDHGLLLAAGPRFAVAGGLDRWLRLPYVVPVAELTGAVERLVRSHDEIRSRSGSASAPRLGTPRPGPLVA